MNYASIFHRQVRVARVFGIPVRIDYRWFIVFALSAWLIAVVFQQELGVGGVQLEWSAAWIAGIVTTLGLFLSIFGHELAHALIGRLEGIETEEIVLHPFGGLARLRHAPESPRAEFRIAAAGPASSFIFALLAYGGLYLVGWGEGAAWAVLLLISGGNLMLAIFNLLPGYPLDGGRVLRAFLWHRSGQMDEATRLVSLGGQIIAVTVVVFGVFIVFRWDAYFMALMSVLVGLFLWDAARAVLREQGTSANPRTVADVMSAPFSVEPDVTVNRFVDEVLPVCRQESVAVARGGRLHGILTLGDLQQLPRERWHQTRVSEVMRPVGPELFLDPSTPLSRADALMKANGAGAVAVLNGAGEIVGFLERRRLKARMKDEGGRMK
ncbi:MAG: site-2 protease family protein [Pyrinomonadaceae bacterium]|nr:site-2 protease family protein [Pyrinomonadaceae bacterium]